MQDHVAIRPFLEQPAGKDAVPLVAAAVLHVELDEGAGLLLFLPWGRRLAGAQAHDRAADTQRLARLHRELAGDAVALVEQADHGDALRHGRAGQAGGFLRHAPVGRKLLFVGAVRGVGRAPGRAAAGREHRAQADRDQPAARRGGPPGTHASGAQAS